MSWSIIALALAPGAAISVYIYFLDKYEKEPLWLLIRSFLLGAIITLPVLLANWWWQNNGFSARGTIFDKAFYAFVSVAGTEELAKYIVTFLFAYMHKAFNEPFDGIVYAVMVAMGFATAENLMYVYGSEDLQEARWVVLVRMFTAVPAHATFGILMGFFMGLAKFSTWKKPYYLFTAFAVAVFFHGLYDFFLFMRNIPLISLGALVSLFIGIRLSGKVVRINQFLSPFKNKLRTDERNETEELP